MSIRQRERAKDTPAHMCTSVRMCEFALNELKFVKVKQVLVEGGYWLSC